MTTRPLLGALSLVLAAGLFVAGCSSLPTSPAEPPAGGPPSGNTDSTSTETPAPAVSVSRSKYVRALLGGTVAAGNFRVVIPVGALSGDAIVTVRQPDVTRPVVELSITPEERNRFLVPVLLVADARPMEPTLVSLSYLSWWNPDSSSWERCGGVSVNLATVSITAPLSHFSTYRVETDGKAGW
ncbi:MAG: hypothetical protein IT347_14750 [Candidatus Eisenbacteria bacterium]|nr:hypothetical protein [Candidatus Eisenbacteria bacterium]